MVCTCCQLHCILRSCCYLTALNPQAVWHLLEVNLAHYLIATSTGGFQPHMQTVNRQASNEYRHRRRQITYVYIFFICTSIPTCNRSLLSGKNCQFMWTFFKFFLFRISVNFMVPRVMKHAPSVRNAVNIQHKILKSHQKSSCRKKSQTAAATSPRNVLVNK